MVFTDESSYSVPPEI